ncbi:MAG: hypothetical protein K2P98_03690 [Neisseriaceae bacterium]|nr:hypothetical protein [Neisseriaceae bacterium]
MFFIEFLGINRAAILKNLTVFLLMGLVTGCGFHLRGYNAPLGVLPFSPLYVEGSGVLFDEITRLLIRDKQTLAASFSEAAGRLTVVSETPKKEILTINRAGKVSEYLLTLTVAAEAQNVARDPAQLIQVSLTRTMVYSDAEILGKQEEEKRLWDDLRREAAGQVIQKFESLKFEASPSQTSYQPNTESLKGTP